MTDGQAIRDMALAAHGVEHACTTDTLGLCVQHMLAGLLCVLPAGQLVV